MQATTALDILLVDDDRPLREMLTRSFEREGHRVTAVPDGETALDAASERSYDVVLLDVALGAGPTGYDVARKRLLQFLVDRRVANPIVLTGDIHANWVNDLKVDFDRAEDAVVATEFVGSSISSGGNGTATPRGLDALLSENPFVRFHNAERGYVRCTVTPREWRSEYQVVEFVDRPGAPLITRRSLVVESGRPGAQTA